MYTIIRKRQVFHSLANLPTDYGTITKSLSKKTRRHLQSTSSNGKSPSEGPSMEGSKPALPAEPGTLKASLLETPGIDKITEQESAHPLNSLSHQSQIITNHSVEDIPSKVENLENHENHLEDEVFSDSNVQEVDLGMTKSKSMVSKIFLFFDKFRILKLT